MNLLIIGIAYFAISTLAYSSTSTTAWTNTNSTAATGTLLSGLTTTITLNPSSSGTLIYNSPPATATIADRGGINSMFTPNLATTTSAIAVSPVVTGCTLGANQVCSRGTMTIQFSQPVINPVIHLVGLGGTGSGADFSTQLALAGSSPSGATLGSVSGGAVNMQIASGNTIRVINNNGATGCGTGTTGAGCGSVQINGTVTSLTFDVSLLFANGSGVTSGTSRESFDVTVTAPEDFSDAPASFNSTQAPTHVLSDLRLGTSVDEDNVNVADSTTSPNAVAAGADNNGTNGDGADEDAITTFPALYTNSTSYSLTVPISGASKAGQVCGWIDFNNSNAFDTTERACTSFSSGATSVNLSWTGLSGLTVGNRYVRLRASYNTTQVQSPTGRADSGEVEDYRIAIQSAVPDLTISKSHSGNFTVGSTGTYSFSVGNSGNAASSGTITVTDTLPTGLTVNGGSVGTVTLGGTNSANWTCNSNAASPQVVTCISSNSIAASGSSIFSFAVNVGANTAVGINSITNTATVSGGGQTNTANDSASDPTTIVAIANLGITKTDATSAYIPKDPLTYTIVVNNAGPSSANNVVFTDPVVPDLTVTSVTCGSATGGAACPTAANTTVALMQGSGIIIPTLPNGGKVTFTVNATPGAVYHPISNTASITAPSGVTDPNTANNSATDTDTVVDDPIIDVGLTKSGPATASPSSNITYTLALTNQSFLLLESGNLSVDISNVTVVDTLPAGVTFVSASDSGVYDSATNKITWNLASLTADQVKNLTVVVTTPNTAAVAAGNNKLVNNATVSTPGDSNSSNNNGSATTNILLPADLTIAKSHTGNFTRNSTGTYTLTVGNSGGSSTSGIITVTDTLPTGLNVANGALTLSGAQGANWSCSASSNVITCTSSTAIAASGLSIFSFNVNVASTAPSTVTNTATVSGGGEPAANNGNNTATDSATISQPTFSCDSNMYLVYGPNGGPANFTTINTSTNPLTYPLVSSTSFLFNGLAYNTNDNYIYAVSIELSPTKNQLVRIGSDGIAIPLGTITGLPFANYVAGEIAPNGKYYIASATALYSIDLATLTATQIGATVPNGTYGADMAWVNGKMYTISNSGDLRSIDLTSGAVTNIGNSGVSLTFGALYGDSNSLFGAVNTGGFYQIDLNTGAVTLISNAPIGTNLDGAHCRNAPIQFASEVGITKTDGKTNYSAGANNVYTITATNNGPFGAQNVTVSDPLPSGITTASWTCAATGGGTCAASGTGAINDTTVDLPAGAVATYTLTMAVPTGFTGNLTNTATVTVSSSNTDSNPGNNSASDTDNSTPPNMSLLKSCPLPANCTATPQIPGTDLTYKIAFTNSGGQAAANMIIVDAIPANTDYKISSATTNTATTGLTIVIENSNDYDPLNPTLATWSYTPVSAGGGATAGYDRNVKAIRWRTTAGTLSNVTPNNTGDVSFITKIR